MQKERVELLSPAGSIEAVKAAIANGCNAIYLGGKQFNARAFASNFDNQQLEEVCDYAHLRKVKIYVTVNTLYKDEEFPQLLSFINELSMMGVDGLIMQDLGAISLVRKYFPDLPVHASTQLTSNSLDDVLFYQNLGLKTVVMSRELSLKEIRNCCENSDVRIEVFVHGALCVGYSGQCLMSSLLGDRSGNRGKCAQVCRMNYSLVKGNNVIDDGYLISTKDICTLKNLPQMIEAGVASFKIEGRMKSPQYVALVTSIYRHYIDLYYENKEKYEVREEDIERLLQIFNREGFSSGYLNTHSGLNMMSKNSSKDTGLKIGTVERYDYASRKVIINLEKPLFKADGIAINNSGTIINSNYNANQKISLYFDGKVKKGDIVYKTNDKNLNDEINRHLTGQFYYQNLSADVILFKEKNAVMTVRDDYGNMIRVEGETVQPSLKQPLSREKITAQLSKTGDTVYRMKDVRIKGDEDIFMPLSQLNQLRVKATEKMDEAIISSFKRENREWMLEEKEHSFNKKKTAVSVVSMKQFDTLDEYDFIDAVYFALNSELVNSIEEVIERSHQKNREIYVALPPVYRDYIKNIYKYTIDMLVKSNVDGFVVSTVGPYWYLKDCGKKLIADFRCNIFNQNSVDFFRGLNFERLTMSVEMSCGSLRKCADEKCEQIVYGYLPMMITHQCPIGNYAGNKKEGMYCQKRKNAEGYMLAAGNNDRVFPIMSDCDICLCTVLNSRPLSVGDDYTAMTDNGCGYMRIQFTIENEKEVKLVMDGFSQLIQSGHGSILKTIDSVSGHYFREVL